MPDILLCSPETAQPLEKAWSELHAHIETLTRLNDLIEANVETICRLNTDLAIHGRHSLTKQCCR